MEHAEEVKVTGNHSQNDTDARIPLAVDGLDWNRLTLSREEGFVFSRIDGIETVSSIIRSSGLAQNKIIQILETLQSKGVITWNGAEISDTAQIDSTIEISAETQREIQVIFCKIQDISYYALFGLAPDCNEKEIKQAYFKLSRKYHPDSYFRKNLGEYRSKIETIFKKCSVAYETLSSPTKRAIYDLTLPYEPTEEDKTRQEKERRQAEIDRRLKTEKRKRILRNNLISKKKTQAREYYEDALRYQEKNDPLKAANSIRLALVHDPGNPNYQKLLEDVGPKAGAIRSENEYKRGRYEESIGNNEEALTSYLKAIECNPNDTKSLYQAAALLLHSKRELKMALTFCRKAQQLDPNSAKITKTLAELYLEMGMNKNAIREYKRALEINPIDEFSGEQIKKLRKQ